MCGAVLYFRDPQTQLDAEDDDLNGTAVHDNPLIYHIIYWYKKLLIWRKFPIALIDIRYLTKARNRQS